MFSGSLQYMDVVFIQKDRCMLSQISWLYKAGSLCGLVAALLNYRAEICVLKNKQTKARLA